MKASKVSLFKVWIFVFICMTGLLSVNSCEENKRPSYIIIAADQLSLNSFSCGEERTNLNSGLNVLCQESIRFSNAFTTSTQSAAAMGSLLSGNYPYNHKLHRSFDRIDPQMTLLQELFKNAGYRTSFFSGKPTIMKKTGLSKGFNIFDDTSFLNSNSYSLNFKTQIQQFQNWFNDSTAPSFSIIYTSDLESLNEGETEVSGLESFDEKLGSFFKQLKKNNLWETHFIIVLGLQGKSDYNRPTESLFSNLHSENTNIALFIKPPRQQGDEGIHWRIDTPITLADLGYSLMKTINPNTNLVFDTRFPIYNFSGLWSKNETENLPNQNRKVLIESANTWKKKLELRFALIFKNYLFLEADKNKFYNRLTDGLESIDLMASQQDFSKNDFFSLTEIRQSINAKKWTNYQPSDYNFTLANREYWSNPNNRSLLFKKEMSRLKIDSRKQPLSILLHYYQNPKLDKKLIYENARRESYNLSLENILGLWPLQ